MHRTICNGSPPFANLDAPTPHAGPFLDEQLSRCGSPASAVRVSLSPVRISIFSSIRLASIARGATAGGIVSLTLGLGIARLRVCLTSLGVAVGARRWRGRPACKAACTWRRRLPTRRGNGEGILVVTILRTPRLLLRRVVARRGIVEGVADAAIAL